MAKGAVQHLRSQGVKVGLFKPITLWPFPIDSLLSLLDHVSRIVVVEASPGQLEDEMRLALSHAGVHQPPAIDHVRRFGGILPQQREIVAGVMGMQEVMS
jgi:pyruvate/2-oxoacid:ferredoxin oxidoreductase alpha subunit